MMVFWETLVTAGAWLGVMLTPWRQAADQLRRAWSRVRRSRPAAIEQICEEKSAHIPQHKATKE
jgi:hypothetical protein